MTEAYHCEKIVAWKMKSKKNRLPAKADGGRVPAQTAVLGEEELAIDNDTIVVQAITTNPETVLLLGLIYSNTGAYTPENLLGLIKFLRVEHQAKVNRKTLSLIQRAQYGVPSNIKNPYGGRQPFLNNTLRLDSSTV